MKRIIFLLTLAVCYLTSYGQQTGTFTDERDGKVYKTVTIGTQIWMAENLAYKVKGGCWAYGWDKENQKRNVLTYGYLYDWKTAKKVCPPGWHLPSDAEWKTLISYLGGESVAGNKMKESGTAHWNSPNEGATNESGFTAIAGGIRDDLNFSAMGFYGGWWSFTEKSQEEAYRLMIMSVSGFVDFGSDYKSFSHSVRCVKD